MMTGLTMAARLGGFFALDPGPLPDGEGERPATDFYRDPGPEIARAHSVLGGHEREVASVTHLGYAAKLVSPVVAATLLTGAAPLIDPGSLPVRCNAGGGLRPAMPDAVTPAPDLRTALLDAHFVPLAEGMRAAYGLAPTLLWGNVASALANLPRVLPADLRAPAVRLIAGLLDAPPLAGAFRAPGVRRTCCLFVRLPRGGACGDCPVVPRR